MGREIGIEEAVVQHAEDTGWVARKMRYVGRHGAADRFFFGYGQIVPVEFKKTGKGLAVHQALERDRLAEVGVTVHLIDSVQAGVWLLDRLADV